MSDSESSVSKNIKAKVKNNDNKNEERFFNKLRYIKNNPNLINTIKINFPKTESNKNEQTNEIDLSPIKKNRNNINNEINNYSNNIVESSNININKQDTLYLSQYNKIEVDQINLIDNKEKSNQNYSITQSKFYFNKNIEDKLLERGEINFTKLNISEIKSLFNCFDLNNNGSISANKLKIILKKFNENPSDEEIDEMIKIADYEGDGQINFQNFNSFINNTFYD